MTQDIKHTLTIFQTQMPIKANMKELETSMQKYYENNNIYQQFKLFCSQQNKKYTLHDGPPYANGPIHLGHAYNKIMKDIAIRSHAMMGFNAHTIPGWDCHGLPIEHKILQQFPNISRSEIKQHCRQYAAQWIINQKDSFKKLAVMMDFENPYLTMNYTYQADILRAFGCLFKDGYIYRAKKTIPWCCHCQTTLATAEIEYKTKKDPSLYVLFKLCDNTFDTNQEPVYLVIWTTTPWTLPLNRGVMLKNNTKYLLISHNNNYLIIGKDCYQDFATKTNKQYTIIKEFLSSLLENNKAAHPFEKNITVPIILEDAVEIGEGTACVHTAPGCGPIDYEIGIKNNLEIYSPISPDGRYTKECKTETLIGKTTDEALGWVIETLHNNGLLWHKTSINHSYPHCWRSKDPLIFRATQQWFCTLEKNNFKERIHNAINTITFWPSSSRAFLESTIANRWEWCISRQRAWGVPIAALINEDGNYWTSDDFITFVANKIEKYGIEYWDTVTISDLKLLLPSNFNICEWKKETDIFDVWFDSGVSHFAVLKNENRFPADVYLEGVDQHRGWFQSSLLTSIALSNQAPMKTIVSCGHTVDEKGQKMSKSLGNVITPEEIINIIGLDGLRLWVSSVNLGGDIVVGKKIFENIAEVYRKIRNTCRFAVQNITDFIPTEHMIPWKEWTPIEKLIIEKIFLYQIKIITAYKAYNYPEIFHTFIEIFNTILSSFYFDSVKDVLYCYAQNSKERRTAQTILYIILESLTRLLTPLIPFTTEDITNYYHSTKKDSIQISYFYLFNEMKESMLWQSYFSTKKELNWTDENEDIQNTSFTEYKKLVDASFNFIMLLREKVFAETETLREANIIKQSTEAAIYIYAIENSTILPFLKNILLYHTNPIYTSQVLQVSSVELIIVKNKDNIEKNINPFSEEQIQCFEKYKFMIIAKKHSGTKCQRCWKYFANNNQDRYLCSHCHNIISHL